jgi:hypothetical protein
MIGNVHFLPTPAFTIMSLRDDVAPRIADVWLPIAMYWAKRIDEIRAKALPVDRMARPATGR